MAIELPGEVVDFLSIIGINWPTVNEDKVREFAGHVREFAENVDASHQQSTATVQQLGQAYEGASYEALLTKWAAVSDQHLNELVRACHVVAQALDAAADVIVAMKVETIAELVALAAAFVADQAAAIATLGAAEAAVLLIEEAAKRLINYLEQQLEQYVIGQVVEAAINPLVDTVANAVQGMVFQAAEGALGVSAAGAGGTGFRIDPDALDEHARTMHDHAETVAGHAQVFQSKIAGVSFE
ncbi:WXG100-like domain-containing protein [Kitasatospora fiedleri]|uniref:WXG100-like domain-containing protein n=1 Tax=Kitasatospora fiedleri TaxID=2991545 RepID=UPI00249CDE5B|nr:WXG100 family type VII secretion target [Kitasatospora fiedleri]